jgi:hypothetical protein
MGRGESGQPFAAEGWRGMVTVGQLLACHADACRRNEDVRCEREIEWAKL